MTQFALYINITNEDFRTGFKHKALFRWGTRIARLFAVIFLFDYETVMVSNSTNINNTNNRLSPQLNEHKKTTTHYFESPGPGL